MKRYFQTLGKSQVIRDGESMRHIFSERWCDQVLYKPLRKPKPKPEYEGPKLVVPKGIKALPFNWSNKPKEDS